MFSRLCRLALCFLPLLGCEPRELSAGARSFALDAGSDGGTEEKLPDLSVVQTKLQESLQLTYRTFGADACELEEKCVGAPGRRRLVKFVTSTPNIGTADFFIGDPASHPDAVWSECHGHYHYHEYASYRLLDAQGNVVVTGHKQAFCIKDTDQVDPEAGPGKYTCSNQGVTVGWADTYRAHLPCQWVDITGVPPGDYVVEVTVNPTRHIVEASYENNVATATLNIPPEANP